jgi:hypothetical protein
MWAMMPMLRVFAKGDCLAIPEELESGYLVIWLSESLIGD